MRERKLPFRLRFIDIAALRPPVLDDESSRFAQLERIAQQNTASGILEIALMVARSFGFDSISYRAHFDQVDGLPLVLVATPVPRQLHGPAGKPPYVDKDELMGHLSNFRTPGLWQLEGSGLIKGNRMLERQLAEHWRAHMFWPVFGPLGERAVLAFNSADPDIKQRLGTDFEKAMLFGQSLAVHLHEQMCALGLWKEHLDPEEVTSDQFSDRAREVVTYLSKGLNVREIAELIGVADATVTYHIKRLKEQLGCETIGEITHRATRLGLTSSVALVTPQVINLSIVKPEPPKVERVS